MENKRVRCSAPDCTAEIELPFDHSSDAALPSAYDEQRAVIARNHGWVAGRDTASGQSRQYCPDHSSDSIAGFAPF